MGAALCTMPSRPGQAKVTTAPGMAFSRFLNCGRPHRKTMTARMMYGPQARSTIPADGGAPSSTEADSPAKRQIRAGFQTRSSRTRATMVMSADMMSGRVGPWKLEKRNCEAAKLIPATAMAGNTSMARPEAAHDHAEPERHDDGKEGQLPADDLADGQIREA